MADKTFTNRAEKLVKELMAIEGDSGNEGRVMEYITGKLRELGVPQSAIQFDQTHRRSAHGGEIGNLSCKLPGTVRGPRRMLMAHTDTVPLAKGTQPVRRGRFLVPADKEKALGADDRAGCAVILATALELVEKKLPRPPLTFLWTVQEEVGLFGARHARLGMLGKPRLAFNFDGGSPEKLTIGATGGYRMEIRVTGIAAHAGNAPEEGVSAIAIASLAIADLQRNGWHGLVEKNGRQGTSNVGVIRGGDATNVVTPRVDLRAEARSHEPAFRKKIVGAIEQAFRKAVKEIKSSAGKRGSVEIDGRLDYESFKMADDEPCVLAAEQAVLRAGGNPQRAICNGGLDANWMTCRGIPTVTLGCGQLNVHTVSERLDLKEFSKACRIALELATGTD